MRDALRLGLSRQGLLGGLLIGLLLLSGCLSPLAMHQAVLEYDRTVSRVEAEMLLLNVARTRHFHPTHFTALSSVAATFEFQTNVGLAPAGSNNSALIAPVFGATAAEKPTMTIIPIQGEEFTSRILTPFDENKVAFLFQQRLEPALILRLMSRELVLSGYGESAILQNDPSQLKEYPEFRRRALHLSSLYKSRDLFVGPVVYEETFPFGLTRGLSTEETMESLDKILRALEKGYQWVQNSKGEVTLSRRVIGRIVITNYNPALLTNQERQQLALEAEQAPRNAILVDVQPGHPGGDYPLRGMFIFRSFHSILQFLADGIAANPEYHVEKDVRTGVIGRNPPWTISIEESDSQPPDAAFAVGYEDRWYSIRKAPRATGTMQPWNQVAFRVFSQLYQMTVTEVTKVPTPSITIAK
jgi:hypothetical protein